MCHCGGPGQPQLSRPARLRCVRCREALDQPSRGLGEGPQGGAFCSPPCVTSWNKVGSGVASFVCPRLGRGLRPPGGPAAWPQVHAGRRGTPRSRAPAGLCLGSWPTPSAPEQPRAGGPGGRPSCSEPLSRSAPERPAHQPRPRVDPAAQAARAPHRGSWPPSPLTQGCQGPRRLGWG